MKGYGKGMVKRLHAGIRCDGTRLPPNAVALEATGAALVLDGVAFWLISP
jgi:hypothetical protein